MHNWVMVAVTCLSGLASACDPQCEDDDATSDSGASELGPDGGLLLDRYDDGLRDFDAGDLTVYASESTSGDGDGDGVGDGDGDATADAGPPEDPLPECTESMELTNALIAGGTVLEEGSCWLVNERLFMRDGTLDIRKGVRLSFAPRMSLQVDMAGQLKIAGTAVNPVSFDGQDATQPWQGVFLEDSVGGDNVWTHLVIDGAGSHGWTGAPYSTAALYLSGTTELSMGHVTIENSADHGLVAFDEVQFSFDDGAFVDNVTPAYLHPEVVDALGAETRFDGNDNAHVRVTFGNTDALVSDATWPALSVPYRLEDRTWIEANLTIAAGAVLEMARGVGIHVRDTGSISAVGSASEPVVFRGALAGIRGAWKGITIESVAGSSMGTGAYFDHCTLADGGGAPWTGGADVSATVFMNLASSTRFTNTSFSNNAGYGVWANGNASLAGFAANSFTGNERVMLLHPDRIGELDGATTVSGNDDDAIELTYGNNDGVTVDATWHDLNVPYRSRNRLHTAAGLTLEAGVELQFPMDQGLTVQSTGSLTTLGTQTEPVTLTGYSAIASGSWLGVRFASNTAANSLSHTTLSYTGSDTWTGSGDSDAAIYLDADASVTLSDVTLGPGGGYGVYLSSNADVSCNAVTFTGLTKSAVYDFGSAMALAACP